MKNDNRGNNLKELILKKSIEIILDESINSLSVRKIASALDMTATNVYNYYGSKSEIIYAIKNYGFKILKKDLLLRFEADVEPLKNIQNFISGYINFAMNNQKIYNIMFDDELIDYMNYKNSDPIFCYSFLYTNDNSPKIKFPEEITATVEKAKKNNPRISDSDSYNLIVKLFISLHGLITVYNNDLLKAFEVDDLHFIKDYIDFLSKPFNIYPD